MASVTLLRPGLRSSMHQMKGLFRPLGTSAVGVGQCQPWEGPPRSRHGSVIRLRQPLQAGRHSLAGAGCGHMAVGWPPLRRLHVSVPASMAKRKAKKALPVSSHGFSRSRPPWSPAVTCFTRGAFTVP